MEAKFGARISQHLDQGQPVMRSPPSLLSIPYPPPRACGPHTTDATCRLLSTDARLSTATIGARHLHLHQRMGRANSPHAHAARTTVGLIHSALSLEM